MRSSNSSHQFSLAGKLLLSHPALRDPSFRRTIVFLPNHDAEAGAFGLIINRPTSEVLADFLMEPPASALLSEVPVFTGGPVGTDELTLAAFSFSASTGLVSCQTHLSLDEAEAMKSEGASIVRAFRGYAGWTSGQLEGEIHQHAWLVKDPDAKLIAGELNEQTWIGLVSALGPAYRLLAIAPDDPSLN
ncbi:MAG TPA: YqgE/AlgH family protein [Chthoniobacterales bacterium]|nr:YqgE/AlgH family protein [Chthoniobacterales bacterium]